MAAHRGCAAFTPSVDRTSGGSAGGWQLYSPVDHGRCSVDLATLRTRPGLYYHTLIEATKVAFADRNRYIADPAFAKVPVKELLSKDYAAGGAR